VWLSLLLDEPPANPRTSAVRDLIMVLSAPVREATGLTAVGVVAQAGVRAFQRDGVRVYDRA
jgi:hypothetical protein